MKYLILTRVNPIPEAQDKLSTDLLIKKWDATVKKIGRDTSKRATWNMSVSDIANAALAHDYRSLLVEYDISIFDVAEKQSNMEPDLPGLLPTMPTTESKGILDIVKEVKDNPHQWDTNIKPEDKLVEDPDTGARKADGNKNRLDLLPFRAIEEIGLVMTYGAEKYDAHNWRKGFDYTRTVSAAMRHTFAWLRGEDLDPDTGLSHIAHAATNLLFLLEMIITSTGKDDRFLYEGESK